MSASRLFGGIAYNQRATHAHAVEAGKESDYGQQAIAYVLVQGGYVGMLHKKAVQPENQRNASYGNDESQDFSGTASLNVMQG